jgi:hypothetical protein
LLILIGNNVIASKDSIIVLGVVFDTKLSWLKPVKQAVMEYNRSLNTIKLIRKYFSTHLREINEYKRNLCNLSPKTSTLPCSTTAECGT